MAIDRDALTGVILAGGLSSRMQSLARGQAIGPSDAFQRDSGHGGEARPTAAARRHAAGAYEHSDFTTLDKGLLQLGGQPLIHHASRFLGPQVRQILISANRFQDRYARYGKVIADDPALGVSPGPLAGVEAALRHMATPWLLVMPVDVCASPTDMVQRLAQAVVDSGALMAYACTRGGVAGQVLEPARVGGDQACQPHPLCMLAHVSLAGGLRRYLLDGGRKVQQWQQRAGAAAVVFDGGDHVFFNINTPEDLAQASQYCKS
jgi:molybdopterin-guanine dinucleotide biosynthesis protein A